MGIQELFGLRQDQFSKASKLANKIYNNLQLDGLSQDAKVIKLALFVDTMKHLGEEIELETIFKLVGGKIGIQLIKEKGKINKKHDLIDADIQNILDR